MLHAGAVFVAVDTYVTYGPPRHWMQRKFRSWAKPGMSQEDVDSAVPHASTRIVGALHILIQVCFVQPILHSGTFAHKWHFESLEENVLKLQAQLS